jgi:fermentation-respiration switch protein FrsA (DUF1100 family)
MNAPLMAVVILSGVYLLLVLVVGRFLMYGDIIPRRRAHPSLVRRYDHDDVEFETPSGLVLRGWFIRSDANPSNRTVVMLHGWSRNRARKMGHIDLFVRSGFHVLTYDQRSHGDSDTGLQTFGKEESEDLESILHALSLRPDVDMRQLVAVGFSLGSGGLIYAAARTPWFRAIVVEGAFANSYDSGKFMLQRYLGRTIGYLVGVSVFHLGSWIWSRGRFKHSSPAEVIDKISPTPVMFIYNANDHMVPSYSAERLISAAREPKEVWRTEHGRHSRAFETYPEEYTKRVIEFLRRHVNPTQGRESTP